MTKIHIYIMGIMILLGGLMIWLGFSQKRSVPNPPLMRRVPSEVVREKIPIARRYEEIKNKNTEMVVEIRSEKKNR